MFTIYIALSEFMVGIYLLVFTVVISLITMPQKNEAIFFFYIILALFIADYFIFKNLNVMSLKIYTRKFVLKFSREKQMMFYENNYLKLLMVKIMNKVYKSI